MKWILVFLSLAGNWLLVKKYWWGFVTWLVCDIYFCYYNFQQGEYPEAVLFLVYMIFAVYGIIEWKRESKVR